MVDLWNFLKQVHVYSITIIKKLKRNVHSKWTDQSQLLQYMSYTCPVQKLWWRLTAITPACSRAAYWQDIHMQAELDPKQKWAMQDLGLVLNQLYCPSVDIRKKLVVRALKHPLLLTSSPLREVKENAKVDPLLWSKKISKIFDKEIMEWLCSSCLRNNNRNF